MPHIVTLLWALLAGLRALPRPRRRVPRLVRPGLASQVAPLRDAQDHPPSRQRTPENRPPRNRPRATPQPSEAEIARAMAQLMTLFAHWQAGTLPPPGPHTLLTGRYRRPTPHAPHRPAPTLRRLRTLTRPLPAARPHPLPTPARLAPGPVPATRPRHVPSPARAAFRGQAPTRPTTSLFH